MAKLSIRPFNGGIRMFSGQHFNDLVDAINNIFSGATGFIQRSVATGLTATGTNQATGLALTKALNVVSTAAASTGVVLPSAATVGVGGEVLVYNDGASTIKVYGAGTDTIDGTAGATGVSLTNANRCRYIVTASGAWKSDKLGVVSS